LDQPHESHSGGDRVRPQGPRNRPRGHHRRSGRRRGIQSRGHPGLHPHSGRRPYSRVEDREGGVHHLPHLHRRHRHGCRHRLLAGAVRPQQHRRQPQQEHQQRQRGQQGPFRPSDPVPHRGELSGGPQVHRGQAPGHRGVHPQVHPQGRPLRASRARVQPCLLQDIAQRQRVHHRPHGEAVEVRIVSGGQGPVGRCGHRDQPGVGDDYNLQSDHQGYPSAGRGRPEPLPVERHEVPDVDHPDHRHPHHDRQLLRHERRAAGCGLSVSGVRPVAADGRHVRGRHLHIASQRHVASRLFTCR